MNENEMDLERIQEKKYKRRKFSNQNSDTNKHYKMVKTYS